MLIPILEDYDKGEYVTQVGHDNERYIIAKTNLNKYYLLNTKEIIVQGPLTQEEFVEAKENVDTTQWDLITAAGVSVCCDSFCI